VSLIVGDDLSCEVVENVVPGYQCWDGMKLEVLVEGRRTKYSAIALQPSECCYINKEEGWRECDAMCVLRYLLSHDVVEELRRVFTENVVMALLSPHPILSPHGLTHITDVPSCLIHILINASRIREAMKILHYVLPALLITVVVELQRVDVVPEQQYIDAMLAERAREVIDKAPRLSVNNSLWLDIDVKQNYTQCLNHFASLCEKEKDEVCLSEVRKARAALMQK